MSPDKNKNPHSNEPYGASVRVFEDIVNVSAGLMADVTIDDLLVSPTYHSWYERLKNNPTQSVWQLRKERESRLERVERPQFFDDRVYPISSDAQQEPTCNFGDILDVPDAHATALTIALGEAVLADAYKVLGDDVEAWIDEFNAVDDDDLDTKYRILDTAYARICKCKPTSEDANDNRLLMKDTDGFRTNHPLRMSHLAIGKYPEITADPTCLGISIITASFLKKCGLDLLHVGVPLPTPLAFTKAQAVCADMLLDYAFVNAIPLNPYFREVTDTMRTVGNRAYSHFDPHAAVLAHGGTDSDWFVFDPYQGLYSPCALYDRVPYYVDRTLEDLSILHEDSPGVEITLEHQIAYDITELITSTFADFISSPISDDEWRQAIEISEGVFSPEKYIEKMLEYLPKKYKRMVSSMFRNPDEEVSISFVDDEPKKDVTLRRLLSASFIEHVLSSPREDGEMVLLTELSQDAEGAAVDNEQIILRNLRVWPYLFMLRVSSMFTKYVTNGRLTFLHPQIEIGHLEHRVGMCVISDLAGHLGEEISPSFWLQQWSSHLPFVDNIHPEQCDEDPLADAQVRSVANYIGRTLCTYSQVRSKINVLTEEKAS